MTKSEHATLHGKTRKRKKSGMKLFSFYLSDDQAKGLMNLSGTMSEHLRCAIREYIQRKQNVSVSPTGDKKEGGK